MSTINIGDIFLSDLIRSKYIRFDIKIVVCNTEYYMEIRYVAGFGLMSIQEYQLIYCVCTLYPGQCLVTT